MARRRAGAATLVDAAHRAGVRDRRVIEAFRAVPRERFVPGESVALASVDEPVPIGHQQVTTQPSLVALMVEALELSGGEQVLEIGTGLGYQAAILGTLARKVYSIERLSDLAAQACENLTQAGIDNVEVLVGDGALGLESHAPFGAIIVAAAAPSVPPALIAQLAENGRLVQPIGRGGDEIVTRFRKREGKLVRDGDVVRARFVPLISGGECGAIAEKEGAMLENATYDLMETATVLSKGLHRYGKFHDDSRRCAECQQIWSYMQKTDEEQLRRIMSHLKEHVATAGEVELAAR